ncbi:MAG: 4-hydroxy-3-methylbut-2-enyl diphosphate reductase [Desulfobacterales bacterium]
MKIEIAKTAGFCMGVRRAVELAMDAPAEHEPPICTFGPLIHNPQVLDVLKDKGITILDDIPSKGSGTVLIRAHGVPPEAKSALAEAGFKVVDATCPRVIRVQVIIRKHARKGYDVIIIGDRDHPEVTGLLGHAAGKGHVAADLEELKRLNDVEKAIVVAQTTQNLETYDTIKKWIASHRPRWKVFDTICDSTEKRQAEVRCLAELVDAVVVVGGKTSGNTQRLFEVAKATGKPAFHVETEADLDFQALSRVGYVGVTAGASTPNWMIKKICRAIEAIPYQQYGLSWGGMAYRLQRTLLLTNLYVALGAGCLAYAAAKLQMLRGSMRIAAMAVLYVLSMHIFNNLTGRKADLYNDPERADFYQNHLPVLLTIAITSGASGLLIALTMGPVPFLVLLAMSLLGLSYHLPIIPGGLGTGRWSRLKDLPGSKTILIAVAWGLVTALLPALYAGRGFTVQTILVFAWATLMVFSRTAFFDLLDIHGDRVVGKETLPVVLGERVVQHLLKASLAVCGLLLIVSGFVGLAPWLGGMLLICPVMMAGLMTARAKGSIMAGTHLEFAVESTFVLSGLLAFAWAMLQ